MMPSPLPWVPSGAWLAPGYAEWAPPAALRGMVACLWSGVTPEGADRQNLVLPDACSDLIWEEGVGSYIAGPDTGPVRMTSAAGRVVVGARFHPSAGGRALGLPLSEIRDQRVGLADLLPAAGRRLPATLGPAEAASRLFDVVGGLVADAEPDRAVSGAAVLLRDPAARTEDVAGRVGISDRQLRRRCQAAAGYGPKTLQRVLRFQRFVQLLDARYPAPSAPSAPSAASAVYAASVRQGSRLDLAAAAIALGYADQAHLTRECVALSGLTPVALSLERRPPATGHPAQTSGSSAIMAVPISRKPRRE